ncbi:uncharacterized protein EV420DRAFT_1075892 [Desarmillaria tabescens]|uniref:Uncharacterized protein n=1 Tax=Armillaria tabescens TaxID=1929756 RepID=A0AA39JL66_ARMTA|nr:uncharacterized protein EV420DRAFT_1075892 [Desarmillaria tabescens]KAK0442483.1 hypothetical protein EV420DRAFT_1075892 [Desarmillaria tabescens]
MFLHLSLSLIFWTLRVFALNISVPRHGSQNRDVMVNLTYSPSDSPCFFLRKVWNIHGQPHLSRNAVNITGFTANVSTNITFEHVGTFRVFAFNISDLTNYTDSFSQYSIAQSQSVHIQWSESLDDKNDGRNRKDHKESKNRGNRTSGNLGTTQTVKAVPVASASALSDSTSNYSSSLARASPVALVWGFILGLLLVTTP